MAPLSSLFIALARLAQYSPKGKSRLAIFFLKLAADEYSTPTVYGPRLRNRWHDTTFRFCVSGYYGRYLSDFLWRIPYAYSFVDIGANVGLYSLIAANTHNCKNCYAFEPNPAVFEALQQNATLNNADQIHLYNCAISNQDSWLAFAATETHSGIGKLVDLNVDGSIRVKSLDRKIFDQIGLTDRLPKIVKIDVEGHEPIVIGELMKSKMRDDIRYLYFEANDSRYDVARVSRTLESYGFRKIFQNGRSGDYDLMFVAAT
jgi:FkbM family methyltransferase